MMQCDTLAEVDSPIIERLPVEAQLEIVLQVYASVCTSSYRPESGPEFAVMHPDLDILAVEEHV